MTDNGLSRFLGGSPSAVLVRLIFVSLIVGFFLAWFGVTPASLFFDLRRTFFNVWSMGFGAVREVGDYILAGALIVVPVWLVTRLLNLRGR